MTKQTEWDIEYVIEALRLGLKQNLERYPNMMIHMQTATKIQIELLLWILGRGKNPYPLAKDIVELKKRRDSE